MTRFECSYSSTVSLKDVLIHVCRRTIVTLRICVVRSSMFRHCSGYDCLSHVISTSLRCGCLGGVTPCCMSYVVTPWLTFPSGHRSWVWRRLKQLYTALSTKANPFRQYYISKEYVEVRVFLGSVQFRDKFCDEFAFLLTILLCYYV